MKKVLLFLGLLGSAGVAQAQRSGQPANTIGITAAYARTNLSGGNAAVPYTSTTHSAYQAGLTADAYLSEVVSFHPEVLYTMRYFDATNSALSRDITSLDVPLLARYHADGLFFEAGPQVTLPLTAKNETGGNVKSEVNTVALDYVFGLGYQLNHGPSLGVRYDGGATPVFKSDVLPLGPGKFRSHSILVVLGYAFGG